MKKFLIAGSSLAAVAAAGSAGAVDVTLGGSIDMGVKYGVGKDTTSGFGIGDNYQSISISVAAAGTTDGGLKFGGSFGISTADELAFNPYAGDDLYDKYAMKLANSDADVSLRGIVYNVSGGAPVTPGSMVSVKINLNGTLLAAPSPTTPFPLRRSPARLLCVSWLVVFQRIG